MTDMTWTPNHTKIINALKGKISALCGTATKLPEEVGITGFVFEPRTGLVMHFGNIQFPHPQQVLILHEILATAIMRMQKTQVQVPIADPNTLFEGGVSSDIETREKEAPPNEFALADELAKLVLMMPSAETSPEVVAAAQNYFKSRIPG